ncbi:MAG: AI-2E family transporter [Paucibacter sp.]|nr:AI-2E family transporter [Roseateles sp.]
MTLTKTQRLALGWCGIAVLAGLLLWLLAPVLAPFVGATVLAYALTPAVARLVAWRLPRPLAAALVELVFIVIVLAVALLIVPILSRELPQLREQIPRLAVLFDANVSPWLQGYGVDVSLDPASIKAFLFKYLGANVEDWAGAALSSARIGGSFLLAIVGNAVLLPVVLFYLLLDWPRLMDRCRALVPPRLRAPVHGFAVECDAMLGQYLRGQILVMLLLAAYYSIALAIAGFDLALPIGVFTGLAVCVPYLGYGLGLLLALLAGGLQFASVYGVVAVAVCYGLGQLLEGFVLTPRLVGERIGLGPLTVIFALLAFGHLFGFVGVLVALPVSALGVVATGRVHAAYLRSALYQG